MRFTEHNETGLNANSTATVTAGLEIIERLPGYRTDHDLYKELI